MRALQDAHRDSLDHLSDLNDRTTVKANLFGDHEEVARSAGEVRSETRRIFFSPRESSNKNARRICDPLGVLHLDTFKWDHKQDRSNLSHDLYKLSGRSELNLIKLADSQFFHSSAERLRQFAISRKLNCRLWRALQEGISFSESFV